MEALKSRMASKLNKQQGLAPVPKAAKEQVDIKYTEDEKKCIADLKKLYVETIKLDIELQRNIYNMEKMFETRHSEVFDKRRKILEEFKKNSYGDANPNEMVPKFWLNVLKASYTEFISKSDETVLAHLTDIRSKLYNEPHIKFVIEFHFEPNEYFTDCLLTKTYFLNCLPDPEEPLSYDGAEIYKCDGCPINWKNPIIRDQITEGQSSFFDFFSPPELPEDPDDANYCDINAILQNDFELGFYLKERIIPKAVLFFTGEIADCQSSESESESEETEESESEDYEEGEEEESSPNENEK